MKRVSIAEARHDLAALIHEVEKEPAIEITRRGAAAAVLLSAREYARLSAGRRGFAQMYADFAAGAIPALPDDAPFFAALSGGPREAK